MRKYERHLAGQVLASIHKYIRTTFIYSILAINCNDHYSLLLYYDNKLLLSRDNTNLIVNTLHGYQYTRFYTI